MMKSVREEMRHADEAQSLVHVAEMQIGRMKSARAGHAAQL